MEASSNVYCPVTAYQTRIIRLHGANDVQESPLVCTLYVADILHPSFEGLGIRSLSDGEDCLVEYDALSYVWGVQKSWRQIICNNMHFSVTEGLFEALTALRYSERDRYLWVDAICINQGNSHERALQVHNMLTIYQKAAKVIAWLGPSDENTNNVLTAAALIDLQAKVLEISNLGSVCIGLTYLYTRPWFQRVWVQQEIFAARQFIL
jgi:hypothetical protein